MKNYPLIPYYKTIKNYPDITIKELIRELNKHDINKNIVIYSNEEPLIEYGILGSYENEGQVELHINNGVNLG